MAVEDVFPPELIGCEWSCAPAEGAQCTGGPVAGGLGRAGRILLLTGRPENPGLRNEGEGAAALEPVDGEVPAVEGEDPVQPFPLGDADERGVGV